MAFGVLFIIALAVYVTVLFFLKSFHSDDIEILGAALRRGKMPENWVSGLSAFLDKGVHG
jgi:hypothetical protein